MDYNNDSVLLLKRPVCGYHPLSRHATCRDEQAHTPRSPDAPPPPESLRR